MWPLGIIWDFLKARRTWWLPPILLVLLVWFGLAVAVLWPTTWWPYENKMIYPLALGPSPAEHTLVWNGRLSALNKVEPVRVL